MYKVKRTIYVDNQSIDVWFGLVSKTKNGKNGKYTVYLLTDDPNNPYNHAEPILSPPLWWRFSFKNRRY